MKFDKSRVYTALNADELKVGSKVIAANTLKVLVDAVGYEIPAERLISVQSDAYLHRFIVGENAYAFAYLVEEPAKLKWTDLKIGDVIRKENALRVVTGLDTEAEDDMHIRISSWLADKDLEEWERV